MSSLMRLLLLLRLAPLAAAQGAAPSTHGMGEPALVPSHQSRLTANNPEGDVILIIIPGK